MEGLASIVREVRLNAWRLPLLLCCWLLVCGNSCSKDDELIPAGEIRPSFSFSGGFRAGKVSACDLTEASGIAAGLRNPDIVWAHNDSGDGPRLFALNTKGEHVATYYLQGVTPVDWEDMASAPGRSAAGVEKNYLYLADIGDNPGRRPYLTLYRIEEPVLPGTARGWTDTVRKEAIDAFFLRYEDGARDAETFLLDAGSGKAYIVSKERSGAGLYGFSLPAPGDTVLLRRDRTLPYATITGGDISADGNEILLKNYRRLFYWHRTGKESLEQTLSQKAKRLPYVPEPQGEAIGWKKDGSGFFTLSEEVLGIEAVLYWHRRK